jgi:Concanavalin A-like lectin/glucanases superfamily/Peptidase family M23
MAVALSWKGCVDTNVNFAEFFSANHTLITRFMPQFPNTYEGPFVAENGTGTFGVGQGDFLSGTNGTKLYLAVGTQMTTRAATLTRDKWHHLAVVVTVSGTQRTFALYLDGTQLGQTLSVALNAAQMPAGTLRFGKRTTGQTVNGHNAQTYGLLDDIAIFTRALTASEIQNLRNNVLHLTGNEADLLVGYTFAEGQLSSKLARPITFNGGARRLTTSVNRDSASDAALLPQPTRHQPMDLPFPPGEAWSVIQGVDDAGGSHKGYASFCWDFKIADQPQGGSYPTGSNGAPFYASAPGTVVTTTDSGVSGTSNRSNIVEIEQAPGEICAYLHLKQNSSLVSKNDHTTMGHKLALTGDTGANVGAFHVHLATTDKPDGASGFVTFPVAFSDYELRVGSNTWQSVARGLPTAGQVIRIPATPTFGVRGLQIGNAIARGANLFDVLATDTSGRAWVARWVPSTYARNWDRWRLVLSDIAVSNTPPGVVARDKSRLDVSSPGTMARHTRGPGTRTLRAASGAAGGASVALWRSPARTLPRFRAILTNSTSLWPAPTARPTPQRGIRTLTAASGADGGIF